LTLMPKAHRLRSSVTVQRLSFAPSRTVSIAAQEGRHGVAELLIQEGAIVDDRCDGDLTPSLIAAMQGHGELVRLLLEGRADIGVRTGKGSMLVSMAARHGRTDVLKVLVEMGGTDVLDAQNTEGLSALAVSKAGRHREATGYIQTVLAAKRRADLIAWEEKLPDLLQELDPPSRSKTKAKSRRKGKVTTRTVCELTRPSCSAEAEATNFHSSEQAGAVHERESDTCGKNNVNATEDCDEKLQDSGLGEELWVQVKGNGVIEPVIAIVSHESPALVPKVQPSPMLSPMASFSVTGPITPMSAQSSTPCVTASPFGLRSVLPPWPSTPESWPRHDEGLGCTYWPGLPPAVNLDVAGHCQSVFGVPWWPHQLTAGGD